MELSKDFKDKVVEAILKQRQNFDGSDAKFAKQIEPTIRNYLGERENGEREKLIADSTWLQWGRRFGVTLEENSWKMARTDVFTTIEGDVLFCKEYSSAMICCEDVGIGKSYTAEYLARTLKNCFCVDAKQAKSKQRFIRLIARTVGVDDTGRYTEVKENLKYYLRLLPKPMVIIDDAGYLETPAYMELLELIDATQEVCGWYQIGDDSLRQRVERSIQRKKVGFKAMLSRHGKIFPRIVPAGNEAKKEFYIKLITDVLSVNMDNKTDLRKLVNKSLQCDLAGNYGDLRRAKLLLRVYNS